MPSTSKKTKVRVGLFVRLEAKPGKEAEVASFLEGGLALVEQEPATATWYGIKLGPSTFGIFDTCGIEWDDAGFHAAHPLELWESSGAQVAASELDLDR